jgi:hypothetical protein
MKDFTMYHSLDISITKSFFLIIFGSTNEEGKHFLYPFLYAARHALIPYYPVSCQILPLFSDG